MKYLTRKGLNALFFLLLFVKYVNSGPGAALVDTNNFLLTFICRYDIIYIVKEMRK